MISRMWSRALRACSRAWRISCGSTPEVLMSALQMDIKTSGVDPQLMRQALEQARKARLHILEIMAETIAAPRSEMSPYAPRIYVMKIPVDKIRDVIGPGGKVI